MKLSRTWMLGLGICMVAGGCGGGGYVGPADPWDGRGTTLPATDSSVRIDHRHAYASASLIPDDYLAEARARSIRFGHQSVGGNILAGIDLLGSYNARYMPEAGKIFDWEIGSNGDPQSKIDAFSAAAGATDVDVPAYAVAMMKFCYVDFDDSTDATAVFNAYIAAMEALEADVPTRAFVYWTAPLSTDYVESRQEFNELVRNYCATNDKPLFDIASIESYTPADAQVGGVKPVLYSGYTNDGGHLNTTGQLRVARSWWWLVSRLSGWNGQ